MEQIINLDVQFSSNFLHFNLIVPYLPNFPIPSALSPTLNQFSAPLMNNFDQITVGHRRRVTAVTRLPRWRRRKTWLQVRLLLTILQDMDRCDLWLANRYWIGLTFYTVIFGHYASEWSNRTLAFSDGKQVTSSKEAGDWGFGGGRLTLQSQFSRAGVEMSCWQQCCKKFLVAQRTTHGWVEGWVVHLSSGWFVNLLGPWNQFKWLVFIFLNVVL